jgi:hypothetical protein
MQTPHDFLWDYPGFPSFTYNYSHRSDEAFIAASIGVIFICFLEFRILKYYKLSYYSLVLMFMEIFLVISLRRNLSIDILSGLIYAHYFWILSEKYSYKIDVSLLNIPHHKRPLDFT